ncbi:uncharacterized protein BO95DRAFT_501593 [Aspergillus brunneoviolaceus CBS 621.78]|uniref:Uncharacterized protein n=1 Tax=Aspergillus brunneoviolaceus CBS 621.78 TaxID=1450534 RepID=A0ACD1G2E4_9EURO|nr:hypothetical protein BO95DRAFT_501593 [Aspergillus brunneoviolaceus CBS 621.78]RAH43437.1 hypothetical protein BO95DRAFT_501593 [Aspergillus brunneoviolaceus CBS 621.78]
MAIIANYIIDATGEVTLVLHAKLTSFPAPDNASPDLPSSTANPDQSLKDIEARIQVSAKHLQLASPVFDRQLTGSFTEAHDLQRTGKVDITVEGWDLEALLILLRIIHGRNNRVPHLVSLPLCARIAVLVDYYACQEAVQVHLRLWKSHLETQIPAGYNATETLEWIWVSYFFEMTRVFDQVTLLAIRHGDQYMESSEFPVKASIVDAINAHREKSIDGVLNLIARWRDGLRQGLFGCTFECRCVDLGALEQSLFAANLHDPPTTPFAGWSFESLITHVRAFLTPSSRCNLLSYLDHDKCDAIPKIVQEVETLSSEMQGLDLTSYK